MKKLYVILLFAIAASITGKLLACTNFLVTKGASVDGSAFLSYTADAGGFMEALYYHEGGKHEAGEMVDVYEWDSGWKKYLGKIPQVSETYRVVGNMNEWQLTIGETTYGGREECHDTTGMIDYGSLIYLALQRAKTAREAIKIMTDLVAEYGYHSEGESFSIIDPNEVWIMDMIGKGGKEKGAVWAAIKVPDGYISAHANVSRIRQLSDNKDECLYSPDVVSFAEKMGFYDASKGKPFEFCEAYCPVTPSDLFACEGRVWSLFNRSAPSLGLLPDYFRAVKGAIPYPLYVKPDKKLSVHDIMTLMRDHFEETEFDMTKGMAAGPYGNPYRWKPLGWKIEGDTTLYYWERPISTQQTAFSFVSQVRSHLPREVGGVFWYGVDDNYSTIYTPLYTACLKEVPEHFRSARVDSFDLNSATWVFNLVSNLAYNMYSKIIPDIQKEQTRIESEYLANQKTMETAALAILNTNREFAMNMLSDYSVKLSNNTYNEWLSLWKKLLVKYNDRYINDVSKNNGRSPSSAYYGNDFYKQIVRERPNYYNMIWRNPPKKRK